ncbi:MAG: hypothetical protein IPJ25_14875 [Rhodocyclaceae bacterium]|nr:hypothetical protein [Rhodocyclaceae bacterium]
MIYEIRVHKDMSGEAIHLPLVAHAMAIGRATNYGKLPLHHQTFETVKPLFESDVLDAVRSGRLIVCNERGTIASFEKLIEAAKKSGAGKDISLHLYTTAKCLNAWREMSGDQFVIVDLPVEVMEYDLKDSAGNVIEPGYYRSMIGGYSNDSVNRVKIKPGPKEGKHRELMKEILDALEGTQQNGEAFDRSNMFGQVGNDCDEKGSFHWFCCQLGQTYRSAFSKGAKAFANHRAGLCRFPGGAKPSDFYTNVLPVITQTLNPKTKILSPKQKTAKPYKS